GAAVSNVASLMSITDIEWLVRTSGTVASQCGLYCPSSLIQFSHDAAFTKTPSPSVTSSPATTTGGAVEASRGGDPWSMTGVGGFRKQAALATTQITEARR